MGSFGLRLRKERESKGLRLVDVAKVTRVGAHFLAALEHEDFGALPNDVFVKGFVRVYAECLGIDADKLVAEYLELARQRRPAPETADGEDPVLSEMSRLLVHKEDRAWWHRPGVPLAGGVTLLLVVAVWMWFGSDGGGRKIAGPARPNVAGGGAAEVTPAAAVDKGSSPIDGAEVTRALAAPERKTDASRATPKREPARDLPKQRPAPAPVAADASSLEVPDFGVGTGVRNHQLVGRAASFEIGTRVYFWTRVTGASTGDVIRHVWSFEGRTIASTPLKLGGSHWRTQSRKTLQKPGRWSVEAQDAAGTVLARREFDCVQPG